MRGVFSQKNGVGSAMILGISCYLYLAFQQTRIIRGWPWFAILLMMGCIILSKSATALVVSMIVVVFAVGLALCQSRAAPLVLLTMSVFTALSGFLIASAPEMLLGILGRDASLTGRLPLWDLSMQAAATHPWLGYGYYAFWNADSRWAQYIWRIINWEAPSAHNGYIQVVLDIGFVGLTLYAWMFGRILVLATAAFLHKSLSVASWILLFIAIWVLVNLDEGTMPYPDQFALLLPGVICTLNAWRRWYGERRQFRQPVL